MGQGISPVPAVIRWACPPSARVPGKYDTGQHFGVEDESFDVGVRIGQHRTRAAHFGPCTAVVGNGE